MKFRISRKDPLTNEKLQQISEVLIAGRKVVVLCSVSDEATTLMTRLAERYPEAPIHRLTISL